MVPHISPPTCVSFPVSQVEHARMFREVARREAPNSELVDLADEFVILGPPGEVERCVACLHEAVARRSREIKATLQRDFAAEHRKQTLAWGSGSLAKKAIRSAADAERTDAAVKDFGRVPEATSPVDATERPPPAKPTPWDLVKEVSVVTQPHPPKRHAVRPLPRDRGRRPETNAPARGGGGLCGFAKNALSLLCARARRRRSPRNSRGRSLYR